MSTIDGPDAAAARESRRLGLLAVFGAGFFYSFSPIFVRISEIGPGSTGFWRLLLAIPLIWAASRVLERGKPAALPRLNIREVGFILFAGISFGLSIVVWQIGLHGTSVANSIFLANLHPVFVTLGAWLAFRERLTILFLMGLAMTVIGTALLAGIGVTGVAPLTTGDLLSGASAIFFAVWVVCLKSLRQSYPAAILTIWNTAIAAVVCVPFAFYLGDALMPPTALAWAILLGFAVVNLSAQVCFIFAAGHISASFNGLGIMLNPVLATVLAWLLFHEAVSWTQGIACCFMLAGIALAQRSQTVAA